MLHRVNCTSTALPGLRTVEILTQRSSRVMPTTSTASA